MRLLLSLSCLSLSLIFAGCGTAPERRLEAPAIQIGSLTPAGEGYSLNLRLVNPNTAPLIVSRSTHLLSLGSTIIGRIEDKDPIGIPALGTAPHVVSIQGKPATQIRDYLSKSSGEVPALIESSLTVALSGDDTMTLKTNGRGLVRP